MESMVWGYYVYKELLLDSYCLGRRKAVTPHDPYAVAVMERGVIVGHVPHALSAVCCLFLGKGSTIFCEVTGRRRFSADLPQGGVEVPCTLIFTGAGKYIAKVQKLVQFASSSDLDVSFTASEPGSLPEQPNKKLKKEKDEDSWLQTGWTYTFAV